MSNIQGVTCTRHINRDSRHGVVGGLQCSRQARSDHTGPGVPGCPDPHLDFVGKEAGRQWHPRHPWHLAAAGPTERTRLGLRRRRPSYSGPLYFATTLLVPSNMTIWAGVQVCRRVCASRPCHAKLKVPAYNGQRRSHLRAAGQGPPHQPSVGPDRSRPPASFTARPRHGGRLPLPPCLRVVLLAEEQLPWHRHVGDNNYGEGRAVVSAPSGSASSSSSNPPSPMPMPCHPPRVSS